MIDPSLQLFALYGAVAVTVIGLLYPYAIGRGRLLLQLTSVYRPLSLGFLLLHCLFTMGATTVSATLLPLASVSIVGGVAMLLLEVRSQRQRPPRAVLWVVLAGVLALSVVAEVRSDFGREHSGPPVGFALLILSMMALVALETWQNPARRQSRHLQLVIGLCGVGLGIITARLVLTDFGDFMTLPGNAAVSSGLLFSRVAFPVLLCLMSVALNNHYLEVLWHTELRSREDAEEGLLATLGSLARARDEETGNHIQRTRNYVRVLAEQLAGRGKLEHGGRENFVATLHKVAPLHDIGKVGIPDSILLKPGKLDAEQWEIMKTHASIGENVLGAAAAGPGLEASEFRLNLLATASEIAGGHHENWDGSGYPRGLAGRQIPQSARLMALADVYDALTTERPYKKPWSHADAMAEIVALRGRKFDPDIVDAFLELQEEFQSIAARYRD
jgi:HD-GYP domain-containing protein (c-di-GMP phosphodiesterase class II)